MQALESVLERHGVASPREIAEAAARSSLHGGDLTTSLLQFVDADEARLSSALSECYGVPAAVVGPLPAPSADVLLRVPREIAERYCCLPLEIEGDVLTLAVPRPLSDELRDELGFALGVEVAERVALEVRIRQAIARDYDLPLSPRNQRGIARLEGNLEGSPEETPAGLFPEGGLAALPRPPSDRPMARTPRASRDSEPPRPAARAPSSRPVPLSRRRGPVDLAATRQALARAGSRNEVLEAFFSFVCQYFEYSALFAVHASLAEGLDAWGPGTGRLAVQGVGVPLDLPSSLSEAAESCKMRLTRLETQGIDATLSTDLNRPASARVLILPVSIRGRCALLLYGDNGTTDVVESEIRDVVEIAEDAARALGRIILLRKRRSAARRQPDLAELSASLIPQRAAAARSSPRAAAARSSPGAAAASPRPGRDSDLPPLPIDVTVEETPGAVDVRFDDTPSPAESEPPETPVVHANGAAAARGAAEPADDADESTPSDRDGNPIFLLDRPSRKSTDPPATPASTPLTVVSRPPSSRAPGERLPSVMVREDTPQPSPADAAAHEADAPDAADDDGQRPTLAGPGSPETRVEPPATTSEPNGAEPRTGEGPGESLADASPPTPVAPPDAESAGASTNAGESDRQTTPGDPGSVGSAGERPRESAASDIGELVERLCAGDPEARRDLTQMGRDTVPQLMARFPGPVITERAGPRSRASQCGPLLQALANIGSPATPDVTRSSTDSDETVRRWATLLLGEMPGPDSCRAVVERLADESPRVHQAAIDAARLLLRSTSANLFRKTLFDVAEGEETPLRLRLRTLEHVAKLKDSASVPRLLGLLNQQTEPVVHKALWALCVVTRQDFGRDSEAWWEWWQQGKSRHRIEWLIEALDHRDPRLRRGAFEELAAEVGDDFGYKEDLPREERLTRRARYEDWWKSVGARRYGRVT